MLKGVEGSSWEAADSPRAPSLPPRPSKPQPVELKPHRQVWLSYWKLCRFSGLLSPRRGKGVGGSRTRQSLICFPLGWEGGDRSNFFSAAPWEKKDRPNLGARLETNPLANLSMGGVSTSDWRARTWCRLNNPSRTRLCKSAGAPPPLLRAALRMHFALGSTAMQSRHTHACPEKNSSECLGGREVSSLVQRSTGRPSVRKTPHTRDPLPGAGGNSDKPRG